MVDYHVSAMRINPLVIPLMVVLVTPFAAGLAHTSNLKPSAMSQTGFSATATGSLPVCQNCSISTQIRKLQTVADMGCNYYTQGAEPYLEETAYCQRYACSNGVYYTFSGWTPSTTCLSSELTGTPCPTGTCGPAQ